MPELQFLKALIFSAGSSIKYVSSDFVILDSPPLPIRAHTLFAHTPTPPIVRAYRYCFVEDMTEIYFVNYYQSKNQ